MKNSKTKPRRATQASILAAVEGLVIPETGATVNTIALHGAYCRQTERIGIRVSAKRIRKVLEKNGYQLHASTHGYYIEGLALYIGATI